MTDMSFEEIYSAYFSRVYRYALKLCGNERDAEELTSDVFFKAMNSIDSFRGDSDILSWLCSIAKNCNISKYRTQKLTEELDENTACESSFSDSFEDSETAMELHEKLHNLEEPYKEVFSLRVFGELSFRQIAHIFGKSENWACVTYHRARKKLYEQTGGYHNGK